MEQKYLADIKIIEVALNYKMKLAEMLVGHIELLKSKLKQTDELLVRLDSPDPIFRLTVVDFNYSSTLDFPINSRPAIKVALEVIKTESTDELHDAIMSLHKITFWKNMKEDDFNKWRNIFKQKYNLDVDM